MPREDGLKAGIPFRFSSTNQPAKRGRLPSKLKKYIKENAVSKSDLDHIFKNIIFGKTLNELQDMIKPENKGNLPLIVVGLIASCIHDVQHGTMREMNNHIDRLWGKPAQQIDLSIPRGNIPDTPEERAWLMEQLENEIGLSKPMSPVPKETTAIAIPVIEEKKRIHDSSK